MRYLVTGGAGFIGSHLTERLRATGHEVIVLDNLSTGRMSNLETVIDDSGVEVVRGSILNSDVVDDVMSRCDAVFHLAAAVGVNLIVDKPLESLRTNILGSEIVLEKAHKYDKRTLVTSTSEIYGKNASDSLNEDDDRILGSPLKSRWSYSEAKAIEEILAYTYWRERGLESVIVRLFNTVGPRQLGQYGMVLPRFVSQALAGEPLTIYGDGHQTRCFCYVTDVVGVLVALMEHPGATGQVFNVGSTEEISMKELGTRVVELLGSSSSLEFIPYDEAYEAGFEDMPRRVPDTGRVRALTGFSPSVRLDEIISRVAEAVGA